MSYVWGILALVLVTFTFELGAPKVPDDGEKEHSGHVKIERTIDS